MKTSWKPPESDRPVDIDLSSIMTVEDADAAMWWLEGKIESMRGQLATRMSAGAAEAGWAARIGTAINRTQTTRLRLQNIRGKLRRENRLANQVRLEEAFMNAVLKHWEPEDVREIWEDVYRENPDLKRQ